MFVPPSTNEVNDMKRLAMIMNGETPPENIATPMSTAGGRDVAGPEGLGTVPGREEVNEMANFMRAFNGQVEDVVKTAKSSPILQEALATEKMPTGIKIGSWKVEHILSEGITSKNDTLHKIYNVDTMQSVEGLIFISEAALCIAKMLNNGTPFADRSIRNIIEMDNKYQDLRVKALQEKFNFRRVADTDNEWKQELFEAKFDAAKANAMYIREKIKNIALSYDNRF